MYNSVGTAIITVTQGDWQYLQEWIEYHHNIGVDFFLIAYNGPIEKMKDLPQYDYVKYYDYSTRDRNNILFNEMYRNGKFFCGWINEDTPTYYAAFMQKVENQLLNELLYFFPIIKYCCVIDTDEFIKIKNGCNDITKFLSTHLPDQNSSISIQMQFYTDNNQIYNSTQPVIERFTEKNTVIYNLGDAGFAKMILNLHHDHVKNGEIKLLSPHTCSRRLPNFYLNINDVELSHYFTKSLEEWISKLNPEVDKDYFNRFCRGEIFTKYFKTNKITDEKLLAIPELLKKYNINYNPLIEQDINFVLQYKKVHNL